MTQTILKQIMHTGCKWLCIEFLGSVRSHTLRYNIFASFYPFSFRYFLIHTRRIWNSTEKLEMYHFECFSEINKRVSFIAVRDQCEIDLLAQQPYNSATYRNTYLHFTLHFLTDSHHQKSVYLCTVPVTVRFYFYMSIYGIFSSCVGDLQKSALTKLWFRDENAWGTFCKQEYFGKYWCSL